MKKTRFIKDVLAKIPGYSNYDTFFFITPFKHILSGFCCELTPRGVYIWRFVYPLYDYPKRIHLTFSDRLPGIEQYIDFSKIQKQNVAEEFVRRIKGRLEEAYNYVSLEQFEEYVAGREGATSEMALGFTQVLLGKRSQALCHLRNAIGGLHTETASGCEEIIKLLELDIDLARQKLLEFEEKNKNIIGHTNSGGADS